MDFSSISEAARFGMNMERARLESASQNLALANVAYSSAADANQAAEAIHKSLFADLLSSEQSPSVVKIKTVSDPAHPQANEDGNVFYIDVDPIREMATLVSAVRAYEANVRAYNTNGDMNAAALNIGSNR
ncbi:hypothetical protein TDB9533_02887 [Thalassocella blandensis]|nr:hypothetical protein TDB9533_02887 [Thalassocella blandensis]